MFVAIRRISPHTAADVVLGAYPLEQDARDAIDRYRSRYDEAPQLDPWGDQGHKPDPRPDEDFVVEYLACDEDIAETLYLTSQYEEFLGQILRRLDSWYPTAAEAERHCRQREAAFQGGNQHGSGTFPSYWLFQEIPIGQQLSDKPEDQPARDTDQR